ncbi:Uncharacterised protein [Bordetella pertussis]|nr:Uncharacterised protein [Bordetella pertussis]CFW07848.1 Uncharacterised protein [Bordetella pertussis]CPM12168.1 Uncharacterised protein [Bordetella pertussis]
MPSGMRTVTVANGWVAPITVTRPSACRVETLLTTSGRMISLRRVFRTMRFSRSTRACRRASGEKAGVPEASRRNCLDSGSERLMFRPSCMRVSRPPPITLVCSSPTLTSDTGRYSTPTLKPLAPAWVRPLSK